MGQPPLRTLYMGPLLLFTAFWLPCVVAQFGAGGFGGGGWAPPPPKCPKFSCPADEKPVVRQGYKAWAYGCKQSSFISPTSFDPRDPLSGLRNQNSVDKCCVEKEICHRTCGTSALDCHNNFQKCTQKLCKGDKNCLMMAQLSDLMSDTDAPPNFEKPEERKCASFNKDQQEACECVPKDEWQSAVELRLKAFYKEHNPDKLDAEGELKDTQAIWKQWKGKEPEMFLELTKKYKAKAVEIRERPKPKYDFPDEGKDTASASEPHQDSDSNLDEATDEFAQKLRDLEASKEKAKADEDYDLAESLKAQIVEFKRSEVRRLREEKAAAIQAEDYIKAKLLKSRIEKLDPKSEL